MAININNLKNYLSIIFFSVIIYEFILFCQAGIIYFLTPYIDPNYVSNLSFSVMLINLLSIFLISLLISLRMGKQIVNRTDLIKYPGIILIVILINDFIWAFIGLFIHTAPGMSYYSVAISSSVLPLFFYVIASYIIGWIYYIFDIKQKENTWILFSLIACIVFMYVMVIAIIINYSEPWLSDFIKTYEPSLLTIDVTVVIFSMGIPYLILQLRPYGILLQKKFNSFIIAPNRQTTLILISIFLILLPFFMMPFSTVKPYMFNNTTVLSSIFKNYEPANTLSLIIIPALIMLNLTLIRLSIQETDPNYIILTECSNNKITSFLTQYGTDIKKM